MNNINTGLSLSRLRGMLKWWPLIRSWIGAVNTAIVLLTCLNTPCCTSPWSHVSCVQLLSASWVSFGFWISCLYLTCQQENGQIHNVSFLFSLFDFLFSVEDWNQALAHAKCVLYHGGLYYSPAFSFLVCGISYGTHWKIQPETERRIFTQSSYLFFLSINNLKTIEPISYRKQSLEPT